MATHSFAQIEEAVEKIAIVFKKTGVVSIKEKCKASATITSELK
jgi:hypothetical protein